jgi:hypothetical protein
MRIETYVPRASASTSASSRFLCTWTIPASAAAGPAPATQARVREDRVGPGVRHCLEVLAAIARTAGDEGRRHLRVRLYHPLPSISVYAVDDRAFFSVFLHGQLAVKSPQIEVEGQDSLMGRLVFRELETLWEAGREFEDLELWETEMEDMGRRFGISS